MGDFNCKPGKRNNENREFNIRTQETNENGNRLLELCNQNNMYITNTFFQHRESQIYTWYKWNDTNCKSQIDFILARKLNNSIVTDSKAVPNVTDSTDNKMVMIT
jgi:hypothetical protein